MKIFCLKNNLKEAINLTERITSKNPNLPVLSTILFSVKKNNLKLIATNLELGIEVNLPVKTEKEGSVVVPASVINNFLSSFSPNENINLSFIKENLIISTPYSSTLIKSYPTQDFPTLPQIKENKSFSVSIQEFINALKSVYYSASFSLIKPEISSVFIDFSDKNSIVFAATDSFRLAEKKLFSKSPGFTPVLVPYRNIVEIVRVFDSKEGEMEIVFDKNQIMFLTDNIKLISRTIDGVFPDYKQIIPKNFSTTVVVDKQELLNNLKVVNVFTNKLNEVVFGVHPKENVFEIKTLNQDIGEHNTTIKADIKGDELEISFNSKYLFDCLGHVPSSKVVLKFNGPSKPLVVTGLDDNSFQYLVMPMNT
jgi:DNA polymerase-3 subunit beta